MRWTTIEIVTNDFDSVQRLREATGIKPGALLALNDPRVQQACDAIRRAAPGRTVHCTHFTGDAVNGYVEAEYVAEVQAPSETPSNSQACTATELAPDLVALRDEWARASYAARFAGPRSPEFINSDRYLDYRAPEAHAVAMRVHAAVHARIGELERAARSCSALSRADALYLLDFTGSPSRSIRIAARHVQDPDADARNAATRLLGVFNRFISKDQIAGVVGAACALTMSETFSDRNKSLVLLSRLQLTGRLRFSDLNAKCQNQIRAIARTSNAIQTGVAARLLVKAAEVHAHE